MGRHQTDPTFGIQHSAFSIQHSAFAPGGADAGNHREKSACHAL
jgi:hypothetical protein